MSDPAEFSHQTASEPGPGIQYSYALISRKLRKIPGNLRSVLQGPVIQVRVVVYASTVGAKIIARY